MLYLFAMFIFCILRIKCIILIIRFTVYRPTHIGIYCSLGLQYTQLAIYCSLGSQYTQLAIYCSLGSQYTQLAIYCSSGLQ